jgi:hypothetical protein
MIVNIRRSEAVWGMMARRKTQQNTARINRTAHNGAFCRTFMWAVFFITTRHGDGYIDRSLQIATAD